MKVFVLKARLSNVSINNEGDEEKLHYVSVDERLLNEAKKSSMPVIKFFGTKNIEMHLNAV